VTHLFDCLAFFSKQCIRLAALLSLGSFVCIHKYFFLPPAIRSLWLSHGRVMFMSSYVQDEEVVSVQACADWLPLSLLFRVSDGWNGFLC
jgi:hypothetical protein